MKLSNTLKILTVAGMLTTAVGLSTNASAASNHMDVNDMNKIPMKDTQHSSMHQMKQKHTENMNQMDEKRLGMRKHNRKHIHQDMKNQERKENKFWNHDDRISEN